MKPSIPYCCDCRVKLTKENLSTHQTIRCQSCWEKFRDKTDKFFNELRSKWSKR